MRDLEGGMSIVNACLEVIWKTQYQPISNTAKYTRLKFWALENPYFGLLKNFIGKPSYVFDPYEFGDGYKKRTALWGNFTEPKKGKYDCKTAKFDRLLTREIHAEWYGKHDRATRRAITPQGFAKAFFEANP